MYRLILVLLLAACGHRAEEPVAAVFRAPGPIYSSAVLEPARMAGHWVQVAGYGGADCGAGAVDIAGGDVRWSLCLDRAVSGAAGMVPGKAGRFAVEGMADWWVLWADADYRTMVIGTPSGAFGFVLNREAVMPGDRVRAVRDILRFNGYDPEGVRFF